MCTSVCILVTLMRILYGPMMMMLRNRIWDLSEPYMKKWSFVHILSQCLINLSICITIMGQRSCWRSSGIPICCDLLLLSQSFTRPFFVCYSPLVPGYFNYSRQRQPMDWGMCPLNRGFAKVCEWLTNKENIIFRTAWDMLQPLLQISR